MTRVDSAPVSRTADRETTKTDPVAAWADYVAAARQLDAVRRGAATAAGAQARAVHAAREELTGVRAHLATQQSRLRERGVPAMSLLPSPPEVTAAARSMTAGPAAVLASLRSAAECADAADRMLDGRVGRPAEWPPRRRNLLLYGPAALVVPVLQVLLVMVTPGGWLGLVLVAVLLTPVAFAAAWLGVAWCFPPDGDGRLDRTPRLGALVCGGSALLATATTLLTTLP